jgi:hypothetical protein
MGHLAHLCMGHFAHRSAPLRRDRGDPAIHDLDMGSRVYLWAKEEGGRAA